MRTHGSTLSLLLPVTNTTPRSHSSRCQLPPPATIASATPPACRAHSCRTSLLMLLPKPSSPHVHGAPSFISLHICLHKRPLSKGGSGPSWHCTPLPYRTILCNTRPRAHTDSQSLYGPSPWDATLCSSCPLPPGPQAVAASAVSEMGLRRLLGMVCLFPAGVGAWVWHCCQLYKSHTCLRFCVCAGLQANAENARRSEEVIYLTQGPGSME